MAVVGDPEFLARLLPVVAIDCSALLVFDDGEENAMTADRFLEGLVLPGWEFRQDLVGLAGSFRHIVLRFPPIVRRLWPEVQYPLLELFYTTTTQTGWRLRQLKTTRM